MFFLDIVAKLFRRGEPDCVDVRKLSSEYLEGNLPPSRLERFRAHLSSCGPCRAFIDSLASMVGMLTNLPRVQSPATLKQSIVERIAKEGKRQNEPT